MFWREKRVDCRPSQVDRNYGSIPVCGMRRQFGHGWLAVDMPERREPSGVYNRCMSSTRTQVYLTDEQRDKIDRVAAVEGLSMAQVIRHAVDEYLDDRPDPEAALAATFGAVPDAIAPSRDAWSRG